MALELIDNILVNSGKAIDAKGSTISAGKSVAFASVSTANIGTDPAIRNTVDIIWVTIGGVAVPHQYKGGTGDGNLVPMIDTNTAATAIAGKANIASPTFTGTPSAPTAAPGANTTQLATTAFVAAAVAAGGGGALELWVDDITIIGANTEGDPIKVDTTVIATRAYADSVAGAGVTDGDKGDISVTSGVWTIDNGAVTLAKQANLATKTYIGRTTAGTGVPEAVPVATLKTDLALVKGDVGLGNVDNTSDATKNSATATLTNKRINPRVQTVASSATVTPNADTDDLVTITAQAVGLTIANPSGTPVAGQAIVIRIKDNGTPRTIAFGTEYRAIGITLPTTTVASKTMYMGAIRNATDTKWDVLSVIQES